MLGFSKPLFEKKEEIERRGYLNLQETENVTRLSSSLVVFVLAS
jgi:hypothetical protein